MAIQIPKGYKLPPTAANEAMTYLQQQTDNFGLFFSLDRLYYHVARCDQVLMSNYGRFRDLAMNPTLQVTQRAEILNTLRSVFNVPDYLLMTSENKLSTSSSVIQKVLQWPELSDAAREFLTIFQRMASVTTIRSNMKQYMECPVCVGTDMEGERMVIAHPLWSLLSTSRFSASNPSLQNIPRDIVDIYTAPKGWQMVFSDTGQVEPRITYSAFIHDDLLKHLIILYDDAYYGMLHYILMSPEEEQQARANLSSIKKHEITQDMKDKRQRLKVLGLAGNYGSANLASIDAELGPVYESKIVNHPDRRRWEKQVSEEVRGGTDHFYAYFGTPVYPEQAKREQKAGYAWQSHLVRCGINNPIQTTAAELMHISILNAQRTLEHNEHVAAWKHDEGMFYVPEDKVEERAPILQGLLSYQVEGWIPIGSDLHVGRKEAADAPPVF